MSEVKVGDTAMGAVNVVRYNWQVIAKFGMIVLVLQVLGGFVDGFGWQGIGLLIRIAGLVVFVPFAVNMHKFTRSVADGAAPEMPPLFQWSTVEWIYLALIIAFAIAAGIIAALLGLIFISALGPIAGGLLILLLMLPIAYLMSRLSFVFPQDVFEAKVDPGKSWRDTGAQHVNIFLSYLVVFVIFFAIQLVIGLIAAFLPFQIIAAILGILLGIVGFFFQATFVAVVTLAHKAAAT